MMSAYGTVLLLHSYLRWVFVALAVTVLVRAYRGWKSEREWDAKDEQFHKAFVGTADAQFLLGLLLYAVLSPISRIIFSDKAAMKVSAIRFFGIEHIFGMVIAIALIHVARAKSKRIKESTTRHRTVFTISLAGIVMGLLSVPWPFLPYGRPLFRTSLSSEVVAQSPGAGASNGACPPVYTSRCAACHGENGRGDGAAAQSLKPPPRDFAAAFMHERTDEQISKVIREGGSATGLSVAMPANRDLDDAQVAALARCVRSFSSK